jgi:hypothetical protein
MINLRIRRTEVRLGQESMSLDGAVDEVGSSVVSGNMVLVFQRGDEEPQALPLGKPGGDVSIAWGAPTRRSAIWKVVARPKGDVYVMGR